MALIYDATIDPGKLEVAGRWLTGQPFYAGASEPRLEKLAAYRFDDPQGRVGFETLLVRAGDGATYQIPLSYSPTRRPGFIDTVEHSELGTRFVGAATADPLYVRLLAEAIGHGHGQVRQHDPEGRELPLSCEVIVERPPGHALRGLATDPLTERLVDADRVITAGPVELTVRHRLRPGGAYPGSGALFARWPQGPWRVALVTLTRTNGPRPSA